MTKKICIKESIIKCDRPKHIQNKCGYNENGICLPKTRFNSKDDKQFFCFEPKE